MKLLLLSLLLSPLMTFSQKLSKPCAAFHTGPYYYYSKNSNRSFLMDLAKETQKVIDLASGDTTIYNVSWPEDCQYITRYLGGGSAAEKNDPFLKQHKIAYKVLKATSDYYVFRGYIDAVSDEYILQDTCWVRPHPEKAAQLYTIPDTTGLRDFQISDTAQYAMLYLLRPGKLQEALLNESMYYQNMLVAVLPNRNAGVIKLLKEGQFHLKSRIYRTETDSTLDVHFGKSYYIKAEVDWGLSPKLKLVPMEAQEGRVLFQEIAYKK